MEASIDYLKLLKDEIMNELKYNREPIELLKNFTEITNRISLNQTTLTKAEINIYCQQDLLGAITKSILKSTYFKSKDVISLIT